jgi:UDP-glucuronate decarboxylase
MSSKKKILVTGGAGFLGSHLVKRFLADGFAVTALDNLSTGFLSNLAECAFHNDFIFINHDVVNPIPYEKYDYILNFACPASPRHYQSDPVRTIETNFLGIINMLHLARDTGAGLLQASTSEVYGDPTVSPQSESYWGNVNPIGIRSCYDEGKRAAETLCFDYLRQYDVDARVIRIFNTYGPNMELGDGRVVSNFIVQALRGEPLTIYGDGSQTRSFCYVSDLIEGISKVVTLPGNPGSPINLGNPVEYSILELAELIIKLTSSKSELVFENLPSDDPKQRKPDIGLARSILGWEPSVAAEAGLVKTIEYFDKEVGKSKR